MTTTLLKRCENCSEFSNIEEGRRVTHISHPSRGGALSTELTGQRLKLVIPSILFPHGVYGEVSVVLEQLRFPPEPQIPAIEQTQGKTTFAERSWPQQFCAL